MFARPVTGPPGDHDDFLSLLLDSVRLRELCARSRMFLNSTFIGWPA